MLGTVKGKACPPRVSPLGPAPYFRTSAPTPGEWLLHTPSNCAAPPGALQPNCTLTLSGESFTHTPGEGFGPTSLPPTHTPLETTIGGPGCHCASDWLSVKGSHGPLGSLRKTVTY